MATFNTHDLVDQRTIDYIYENYSSDTFVNDSKNFCLLFHGKINFVGSRTWIESLQYYKDVVSSVPSHIKTTAIFVVYEKDYVVSGHQTNLLSGIGKEGYNKIFGDDVSSGLMFAKHFDGNESIDPEIREYYFKVRKKIDIVGEVKKNLLIETLKKHFDFVDQVIVRFFDNSVIPDGARNLANPSEVALNLFYQQNPDIFDFLGDSDIVLKTRYDAWFDNSIPAQHNYWLLEKLLFINRIVTTMPPDSHSDCYSFVASNYKIAGPYQNIDKILNRNMFNDLGIYFNGPGLRKFVNDYAPSYPDTEFRYYASLGNFISLNNFNVVQGSVMLEHNVEKMNECKNPHILFSPCALRQVYWQGVGWMCGEEYDADDDYKVRWYNWELEDGMDLLEYLISWREV